MERVTNAHRRGAVGVAMIGLMRDPRLRMSEAAALTWGDLEIVPGGSGRVRVGETGYRVVSADTMRLLSSIRRGSDETEQLLGMRPNQIAIRIGAAARQAGLGEGYLGDTPRLGMIRIGRRWPDTIRSICELRDRGVKIRSLAEAEAQRTRYLEADEGSPEAFLGQVLTMFAAWVADQELESIKRRTREGLERARQQGKTRAPPRKFNQEQLEAIRRMREAGASLRRIAETFECSPNTVRRSLQREGMAAP